MYWFFVGTVCRTKYDRVAAVRGWREEYAATTDAGACLLAHVRVMYLIFYQIDSKRSKR